VFACAPKIMSRPLEVPIVVCFDSADVVDRGKQSSMSRQLLLYMKQFPGMASTKNRRTTPYQIRTSIISCLNKQSLLRLRTTPQTQGRIALHRILPASVEIVHLVGLRDPGRRVVVQKVPMPVRTR